MTLWSRYLLICNAIIVVRVLAGERVPMPILIAFIALNLGTAFIREPGK
jgi:hypothetical protein